MSLTVFKVSDLRIRPAVEGDILFLVQLRNRFLDAFLSGAEATVEGTRALLLEMYVAEIDGEPIGTFSLYNRDHQSDSIEFGRFILEPIYLRKGFGRTMLRYAIERVKRWHFKSIVLTVKAGNVPADSLYRDEGFCVMHSTMELKL